MIPAIQNYISEHDWPLDLKQPLQPLLLCNINYNYVEDYPLIGRVILWFNKGSRYPCLVSKIMDRSLEIESINKCITFQKQINERMGYALFPEIFEIAQICNNTVLFEEAINSPTYETELKYAICGPESSLPYLQRTMHHQFKETGGLFRLLKDMPTSSKPRHWGDWAYKLGENFKKTCGFDTDSLTVACLDKVSAAIDSVPIYDTPVLPDLVCPNIFPGPRLIDNITPDIDELNAQLPGIINVFRFIVPYFYSPPVKDLITNKDWLYAIEAAVTDKQGQIFFSSPVRGILTEVGLDPDEPIIIWSFVLVATLFEMKDKLDFYGRSPFMIGGKREEFHQWTNRLVEIFKGLYFK